MPRMPRMPRSENPLYNPANDAPVYRPSPVVHLFAETEPVTMLDWARYWQKHGLVLFPYSQYLGNSLIPHWYAKASNDAATVIGWWSEWRDADIAAVPDRSGHFVITAVKSEGGYDSLKAIRGDLPEIDFERWAPWGEHHLWIKSADLPQTSHHRLGQGLHVLGAGTYSFLPNSRAPFLPEQF